MKYICFHGFLGGPDDFNFLNSEVDFISLDLNEYLYLSPLEIAHKLETRFQGTNISLIGYSFGARMVMKVFLSNPKLFSSIHLLAGHAGIEQQNLVLDRQKKEMNFICKIEELTPYEFNQYWNELDLFKYDDPIQIGVYSKSTAIDYFKLWGLSKQGLLKNELLKYHDQIKWYFGDKDSVYYQYAKEELIGFKVEFIEGAGHRLVNSKRLQQQLIEALK